MTNEIDIRQDERIEALEATVAKLIARMEDESSFWRDWSQRTADTLLARLDELTERTRGYDKLVEEWEEWRVGHEEACRGLVSWVESLELDRYADFMRRQGRGQRFLKWIWRADPLLRPPQRPPQRGGTSDP